MRIRVWCNGWSSGWRGGSFQHTKYMVLMKPFAILHYLFFFLSRPGMRETVPTPWSEFHSLPPVPQNPWDQDLNIKVRETANRMQSRSCSSVTLISSRWTMQLLPILRSTPNLSIIIMWLSNGVARTQKKLRTSKGGYWIKQWFSKIASLFIMETSLKGKNSLQEGANSFL